MRHIRRQKGVTLVLCVIFITVFLALGVSLATISGTNVQLSANQQRASRALEGAESGLEVLRYWLGHVMMDATTPPAEYLATIVGKVQTALDDADVTNLVLGNDGTLSAVSLDAATG